MCEAILKEARSRREYLGEQEIRTIYFGGGTPSVIHPDVLKRMIDELRALFNVNHEVELTLEANPDDLEGPYLRALKEAGVNRLSIGIQSFHDDELKKLNRSHTARQSESSVKRAQDMGLENISIDLMYGLPNTTKERWLYSLSQGVALQVPHLSAYCLTIEAGTVFGSLKAKGRFNPEEDPIIEQQYDMLCEQMRNAGYGHYEVSNFARQGMESKHNSAYWTGTNYLGLGPSAHSYNGVSRQWNVRNNHAYMKAILLGERAFEQEFLSEEDRFNEYLLTRLRTNWGVEKSWFVANAPVDFWSRSEEVRAGWKDRGWTEESETYFRLTESGMLMADQVITELMIVSK